MKRVLAFLRRKLNLSVSMYLIGYLVLAGGIAFALHRQNHDRSVEAWNGCTRTNESRGAIRATFQKYTDVLVSVSSTNPDPDETAAEVERRARRTAVFVNQINELLQALMPVECGPRP